MSSVRTSRVVVLMLEFRLASENRMDMTWMEPDYLPGLICR